MIKREYIVFDKANGEKDLAVSVDMENGSILGSFLYSEVGSFEAWIGEHFRKVLSGDSELEEMAGNVCRLEIRRDLTRIYDMLDEEEDEEPFCEVGTRELLELMEEWIAKRRSFFEKK